jgi:hypothetical protein
MTLPLTPIVFLRNVNEIRYLRMFDIKRPRDNHYIGHFNHTLYHVSG